MIAAFGYIKSGARAFITRGPTIPLPPRLSADAQNWHCRSARSSLPFRRGYRCQPGLSVAQRSIWSAAATLPHDRAHAPVRVAAVSLPVTRRTSGQTWPSSALIPWPWCRSWTSTGGKSTPQSAATSITELIDSAETSSCDAPYQWRCDITLYKPRPTGSALYSPTGRQHIRKRNRSV